MKHMERTVFTEKQKEELNKPLDKKMVKTRQQSGRDLSYIEAWHAIAEANRIFGFDGWGRETVYCKEISRIEATIGQYKKPGFKVGYEAKVRITVDGVAREGTGHGCGTMSDLFDCIESAAKEAESDAMKRALMTFGNQFGLALYDKLQRGVEDVEPKPKEPTEEQKLAAATKATEKYLKELEDTPFEYWDALDNRHKGTLDAINVRYPELAQKVTDVKNALEAFRAA